MERAFLDLRADYEDPGRRVHLWLAEHENEDHCNYSS